MDATPARGRRRTGSLTISLGLGSAIALCAGCAQSPARSLARAWEDLPRVRWAPSCDDEQVESADETEIAENSDSQADPAESSLGSSLTSRFKFSAWSNDGKKDQPANDVPPLAAKSHSGPHDPFLDDEIGRVRVTSDDAESEAAAPKVTSQRDRLRAALSDDSRRNREPDVDLAEQERLRVRIESLMIRATQHFEQDELEKAQRDAELAQRLANVCSLEFSPDEDRPVDLLARIVARLEFLAKSSEVEADEDRKDDHMPETGDEVAIIPSDVTEFDPYSDRRLPPQPKQRSSLFDSSPVVLEAPSFDDAESEPAVSPTAFSDDVETSRATPQLTGKVPQDDLRLRHVDQSLQAATMPSIESAASISPTETPVLEGPSIGEEELPRTNDSSRAPIQAGDAVAPLKRGTVTLDDIDAEPDADSEDEEEILSALVVPRWLALACLSAIAAAVSIWLVLRRAQASF